jgi:hypothetical protein
VSCTFVLYEQVSRMAVMPSTSPCGSCAGSGLFACSDGTAPSFSAHCSLHVVYTAAVVRGPSEARVETAR